MRDFKVRHRGTLPPVLPLSLFVLLLAALASPAASQICTVPGDRSTIQAAADDLTCTEIRLTLAAYPESVRVARALTLVGTTGQPATIEGLVQVERIGTLATLENLAIQSGCPDTSLLVKSRAAVHGVALSVLRSEGLPCPPLPPSTIFADGFESGDTSAWATTVP